MKFAPHDAHAVDDELRAAIVRVEELAASGAAGDRAGVADLAARFGVRGRAVKDHLDLGTRRRLAHAPEPAPARLHDRQDARGRRERVVADELDAWEFGGEACVDRRRLGVRARRSEEHTSELQSLAYLVCRLLLEKKKQYTLRATIDQNIQTF